MGMAYRVAGSFVKGINGATAQQLTPWCLKEDIERGWSAQAKIDAPEFTHYLTGGVFLNDLIIG